MKSIFLAAVMLMSIGCRHQAAEDPSGPPAAASTAAPYVLSVAPPGTIEGTKFNPQPDGSSAFAVNGKNFDRYAVITANGETLETAYGNSGWLTARMPSSLFEKAGPVVIKVVNQNGKESNSV